MKDADRFFVLVLVCLCVYSCAFVLVCLYSLFGALCLLLDSSKMKICCSDSLQAASAVQLVVQRGGNARLTSCPQSGFFGWWRASQERSSTAVKTQPGLRWVGPWPSYTEEWASRGFAALLCSSRLSRARWITRWRSQSFSIRLGHGTRRVATCWTCYRRGQEKLYSSFLERRHHRLLRLSSGNGKAVF